MLIRCKGFIIRSFRRGDEESLQRSINDMAVSRYTLRIRYPYTMKDAEKWVCRCVESGSKSEVGFAVDVKGDVVGGIGLWNMRNGRAEIGYWLARKFWNRGIMTAAVRAITRYGFGELKLRHIYASVFVVNRASARVLEKAGFKAGGIRLKRKNGRLMRSEKYEKRLP